MPPGPSRAGIHVETGILLKTGILLETGIRLVWGMIMGETFNEFGGMTSFPGMTTLGLILWGLGCLQCCRRIKTQH